MVGAFYFSTGLADNLNASASLTTPNPADIHATAGKMTTQGLPIDIAKLRSGQQTLRVGHYNQLPPFYYADDNPQPGFGYEVFSKVYKKASFQKVKFMGFDNNIDLNMQLAAGNIDVIANSWDLPGMRKQFLLTTPYYTKGGLGFFILSKRAVIKRLMTLKTPP